MNLAYVANARIPSEKAHPYQIAKMCEAFNKELNVNLIVPIRIQSPKMRKVKDMWHYYGIDHPFSINRLPSLDLLWLDMYFNVPRIFCQFFSCLQAISFAIFATIYSLFNKADIYYTRDRFFTSFFGRLRFLHRRRIYYEGHIFEPSVSQMIKRGWVGGLVVITHKLKEIYLKTGVPKEKILVAPDGVDLEMFDNPISKEEARKVLGIPLMHLIIGYIGRFQTKGKEKGIHELINAMSLLTNQGDILIYFVGGPLDCVPRYLEIAKECNIPKEKLEFLDRVPNSQIPLYLKAFDICVMPFPWTQHYAYYMSPLKLFEYMASKRPIVASDLPSLREILNEENAVLVEPGNPEALAKGIRRVLNDEELAKRLAEKAYEDVQQYTWDKRAEKILAKIKPI